MTKGEDAVHRFSPRPNRANEISWRTWGEAAFEEAEREDRLVLLSISAVWCHWCHVMDETTYSDPGVIEKINRDYIPVRVDSDMRPDINGRYNQGGWPTTAFLTPSGRAVAGFTYAPAPRMVEVLDELSILYRHRREVIDTEVASMVAEERHRMGSQMQGAEVVVDPHAIEEVTRAILDSWDKGHGGLGTEPKFPPYDAVEFALARYVETGDKQLRSFAISTLDGMKTGELFDHVEGGFFRYATARDWSVPHYEKMLSDNAELISVYLAAAAALDRPDYAEAARRALGYVFENLTDEGQRGFYGSQDADEKYYHRDMEGRSSLEKPAVDRTIYTDSTSRMISAMVRASAVLEDPQMLSIAGRCADFLWGDGFRREKGVCHYFELPGGTPGLWGQPADQAFFLRAIIDLYQATMDARYLERARELADVVLARYPTGEGWLAEMSGGTVDKGYGSGRVLEDMPIDAPDIVVNGHGARALLALDVLAPGHGYREAAGGILRALAGACGSFSYFASSYSLAVEAYLEGHVEVRINPSSLSNSGKEIVRAAVAAFSPRKVIRSKAAEDYVPLEGDTHAPPAVVCSPGSCRPVYSAGQVKETLALVAGGGAEERAAGAGGNQA